MTTPPCVKLSAIPAPLRLLPQWVNWTAAPNGKGEITKIPLCPGGTRRASTTDSATWATFEDATANMNGHGLGFVFTASNNLVAIDLDKVVDTKTGKIVAWADRIVRRISTYAEISPSGSGIHLIGQGTLPTGARKRRGSVEMYSDGRYFTMTGARIDGTPTTVESVDIGWLHRLMAAGLFDSARHPKLQAFMNGSIEGYPSPSEADLGLCSLLARLGLGAEDIDSAFRLSGLYRQKWEERPDYRTRTIDTALKSVSASISPMSPPVSSSSSSSSIPLLRTEDGSIRPCVANVVTLLGTSPEWKDVIGYDEFAQRTVIRRPGPGFPVQVSPYPLLWSDAMDVHTLCWLQRQGVLIHSLAATTAAAAAVARQKENRFHPVVDYLEGLTWDGINRADTWLIEHYGAKDTAFVRAVSRRWLIGACARAFRPGVQSDYMLLLVGMQGMGKSSGLRALVPREEWFADRLSVMSSKDALQELNGVWVLELSELESLRRAEVETVKSFLSGRVDHYRPSYGRHAVDVPRQCVFAGTTNSDTPLLDSENRRFWPVRVNRVDVPAIEADRDQLWAEAVHRYKSEECWWLETEELERLARTAQEEAYSADVWDDKITDWIEQPTQRGGPGFSSESLPWNGSVYGKVSVPDILTHCIGMEFSKQDDGSKKRVARLLRHLGYRSMKEKAGIYRDRRYYVKEEQNQ